MSKKFLIYLLAPVAMMIASCGGGDSEGKAGEEGSDETNLDGMVGDDTLKVHGLNTTIWVPEELAPDGTQIPSQIEADADNMLWKLKSGKKFHIVIRVVDGEGNYIKRKKEELAGGIFKVEYLEDKEDYVMYKASLPEDATKLEFFKFYGVKKVNGEEYEFYTEESAELRKLDVELVKKSFLGFGAEIVEE
jgi:hypothetical protein